MPPEGTTPYAPYEAAEMINPTAQTVRGEHDKRL